MDTNKTNNQQNNIILDAPKTIKPPTINVNDDTQNLDQNINNRNANNLELKKDENEEEPKKKANTTIQKRGKQIIPYDQPINNDKKYNSKTHVENVETYTYFIDPKTGKKISLDNNNDKNEAEEKYKNKTHNPDTVNNIIDPKIYKEIYPNEPQTLKETKNKIENNTNIQNNEQETLSPILEHLDMNATITPTENELNNTNNQTDENKKHNISASTLTVSVLSNLQYNAYPTAKHSREAFANISGFGVNSYNGKVKNYNEDRIRVIASYIAQSKKNPNVKFNISYFSIFDGHGGKKCSEFLKKTFYEYLISSPYFPDEPIKAIRESFKKAESQFFQIAYDAKTKSLLDQSGSCALIMLIINNILYSINLGDSRALYSYNTGKWLLQITRDHKPNDEVEKRRIEKYGGKVYYANKIQRNGKEIELKEESFGKGFTFPYRVSPGGLAVARTIGDFYAKLPELGGKKGLVSSDPCVNVLRIDDKSDFLIMGCDGIYDRLDNDRIFKKIWEYKKKGKTINDIHKLCGQITDAIIKYSMEKDSVDNVSFIFVAFKNFENKMKDPNFEYTFKNKCQEIKKDKIDFSLINI